MNNTPQVFQITGEIVFNRKLNPDKDFVDFDYFTLIKDGKEVKIQFQLNEATASDDGKTLCFRCKNPDAKAVIDNDITYEFLRDYNEKISLNLTIRSEEEEEPVAEQLVELNFVLVRNMNEKIPVKLKIK